MRVRDLELAIQAVSGGARLPVVPRVKSRAATSLCAGNCRSYAGLRRGQGHGYVFDRECLCPSPEDHSGQFLGLIPPAGGH